MNIQIEETEIININNSGWEFIPQDDIKLTGGVMGAYWFNNKITCTPKIANSLSKGEIAGIIEHAQIMAIKNNGTVSLLVYENKAKKQKIFFKDHGRHSRHSRKEYEYSILMFAEEY